jgi:primosomal protein N' (replication factor Y)
LQPLGLGTERIEHALAARFDPDKIVRVDRDSTCKKGSFNELLSKINKGEYNILIGTQILAKGHHFPNVTLAVIINADSGLLSVDLRASERMGQLITQVAGRSGRADKPGEVLIQNTGTYNRANSKESR